MEHIEFKSWTEFRAWVDNNCRTTVPVYWRGQKDPKWWLQSAFERQLCKEDASPERGLFRERLKDYLEAFKQACAGLRGANPAPLDDDQWWALGRHFGLVTPLLDWTDSPYIAAFFAISERLPEIQTPIGLDLTGAEIAIYRLLHEPALESHELRVLRPMVQELGRMHGQRGLFTWLDAEHFYALEGFLDDTKRGHLLTKVVLSGEAVLEGMRDLKAHGIDYRLLFPDLSGAAMHANMPPWL
jgi:hypothetical protein